jgi:hypothetical protein
MSEEPITTLPGPDQSEDGTFTVGPPEAVSDSRLLPAVSADSEADIVLGADMGDDHPDNKGADSADPDALEPDADADEDLPSEDELAALVADVDLSTVDEVGFDDADEALFDADSGDSQIGAS